MNQALEPSKPPSRELIFGCFKACLYAFNVDFSDVSQLLQGSHSFVDVSIVSASQSSHCSQSLVDVVDCLWSFKGQSLEDGAVEFGFSAFEDGKLCALASCHSIRSPERSVKEKISAELAYYINRGVFQPFSPRENVSARRKAASGRVFRRADI